MATRIRPDLHPTLVYTVGDQVRLRARILDLAGQPYDLTGASIAGYALRRGTESAFDEQNLIADQDSGGVSITFLAPGTDGYVSITISDDFTSGFQPGVYYEALTITNVDGLTAMSLHGHLDFRAAA